MQAVYIGVLLYDNCYTVVLLKTVLLHVFAHLVRAHKPLIYFRTIHALYEHIQTYCTQCCVNREVLTMAAA
jgi:hypothetical protein